MAQKQKFVPTAPIYMGKLQQKVGNDYKNMGEIALWKHEGKYHLRGKIKLDDGTSFFVSLQDN